MLITIVLLLYRERQVMIKANGILYNVLTPDTLEAISQ